MAKTKHENCDCIFCNSKCPVCGSINVRVKFIIEGEYANSTEDQITIVHNIVGVRVKFNQCRAETLDDIYFLESEFEFDTDETDDKLVPITKALMKVYPKVVKHNYEGDGHIKETQYNVKTTIERR